METTATGPSDADRPALAEGGGPIVALRDVSFRYASGGFELHLPRLEIERGVQTAVIGPSGSGKTTLLQLIAGILLPSRGSVEVDGVPISERPDGERRRLRRTRIGMIFQELELLDHLRVAENILLPLLLDARRRPADAEEQLTRWAARAGLGLLLRRRPRQLSQGERQRVAILRALIAKPSLLLADEPTGNLDPATSRGLLDTILAEARDHGATLVFVTHDHGLLDRFDRVVDLECNLVEGGS